MKLWKVAATVAVGIWSSGSGMIQVSAADFIFQEDFSIKEVANFDDFKPSFNEDTDGLTLTVDLEFFGNYKMDVCSPGGEATGASWQLLYRANGTGDYTNIAVDLPSLPCSDFVFTTYQAFVSVDLDSSFLDLIVLDDNLFIEISPRITFRNNFIATVISLEDWYVEITLNYNFNTTYLFNYFLSDQNYVRLSQAGFTLNSTQGTYLEYVMTTAGNDRYFIFNSNISSIGTTRKKYAIDYQNEYFRGQSIGARFAIERFGATDFLTLPLNTSRSIRWEFYYHYLNLSNFQQPLADIPQFEFEEQDCGSFLAVNVGCFINNGLAYVVNDAPIISDIFTLLNTGMQLGGQAFAVLGNFTDNNLIGVLVLGGAGLTAVRWFLKQD